ncbi:MAG: LTA synthase family protein [Sedimentisphaerales bacterium]|nr:LTA synthase family protein [Sedimentisphaerales bacterium]
MMHVLAPDLLFFAGVFLLVRLAYLIRPSAWTARGALLFSVLVTAWSILNTCWLFESGVQFQPGVLLVLLLNVREVWPLVRGHVGLQPGLMILLGVLLVGAVSLVVWRLIRPKAVAISRARHVRVLFVTLIVLLTVVLIQPIVRSRSRLGFAGDVLGFSSHWYALRSLVVPWRAEQLVQTRNIPLRGERTINLPANSPDELPNIVIVLLESVPYAVTSMADPQRDATPFLGQLAREGVEFRRTRSVVAQTTKAFWAVLTSTTPVIEQGYIEAVPVSVPYESLATLLRPAGYRSAFFEMSKGTFECAPGLFHNLGFDWAWFRENLEDPSAHLGYMSGDDMRMVEPAMQWVLQEPGPFLLMCITSVSHHPYQLPRGFGQVSPDPYENYLQTVRYTDMFLACLWDRLGRHGRADNTILCVLGDHGTSFRVQMGKGRWIPYEEVTRIPWVIYWPGHLSRRDPVEWPCSQLDVTPTLLRQIGFDISRAGFEGYNALEPVPANRRQYCATLYANSPLGYVQEDQKVIYWPYIDKVFLYDLAADPGEDHPLTAGPQDALRYRQDISDWQQKSQIYLDAKRHTKQRIYDHWWVFSTGRSAWSYYVP